MATPEPSDKKKRRDFASLMEAGKTKSEIISQLMIAGSTFYKWKRRWYQLGNRWVRGEPITKSTCFPSATAEATQLEIVETSLEFPDWGPERLAKQILRDRGFQISKGTIHNMLSLRNLGTRSERALELYQRYLKGQVLTKSQRELVHRLVDPVVSWEGQVGQESGRVLAQGAVQTHWTSPIGVVSLHFVVDTQNRRSFAMCSSKATSDIGLKCLLEAVKVLDVSGPEIDAIYVDLNYLRYAYCSSYVSYSDENDIDIRWYETTANQPNPMILSAWKKLKRFLFEENHDRCLQCKDAPEGLNSLIMEFLLPEGRCPDLSAASFPCAP